MSHRLQQSIRADGWRDPEPFVAKIGGDSSLWGSLEKSFLDQEWLIDFLNGISFLTH
jgi:hypothetical protein